MADAHAVERAAAATAMAFGRIDALVSSAGIAGPNRTTWQLPIDDRRRRSLRPADSGSRQPGANPIDARRTGGDRGDGQA
ncbi:MAG: hypothetical protein IT517_08700 [Burkholderiales bacterium]|nr:hypothetical protein [Burkholderiales bacterium]